MIYVTGDTHQDFTRFNSSFFREQSILKKTDYVIICGDFGGVWSRNCEDEYEKTLMDFLENRPFTTLFVDGNHENFDRLDAYPVQEWNGGKVHKIRPSVIHLMRGQVFMIDGKKIFAFGGASSNDIDDGILEMDDPDFLNKKRILDKEYKHYRVNHFNWWERELPSEEEMTEGLLNLKAHGYEVDYIITHCCPSSILSLLYYSFQMRDNLTDYFESLRADIKYKRWVFGHHHIDRAINSRNIAIYRDIKLLSC